MSNKLIVFEGMWMGRDAYVSAMLRSIELHGFEGHAYNERVAHPGGSTIWFGHSLGGHAALSHARPGDTVITFDPRQRSLASWFDSLLRYPMPFTAPAGVKVFNFYRRGLFLPGQEVRGGENVKLPGLTGHVEVPKVAATRVKEIVARVMVEDWG